MVVILFERSINWVTNKKPIEILRNNEMNPLAIIIYRCISCYPSDNIIGQFWYESIKIVDQFTISPNFIIYLLLSHRIGIKWNIYDFIFQHNFQPKGSDDPSSKCIFYKLYNDVNVVVLQHCIYHRNYIILILKFAKGYILRLILKAWQNNFFLLFSFLMPNSILSSFIHLKLCIMIILSYYFYFTSSYYV